jgi:arginyl-tRNA synthetase
LKESVFSQACDSARELVANAAKAQFALELAASAVPVFPPRDAAAKTADLSCSISFELAGKLKQPPAAVADALCKAVQAEISAGVAGLFSGCTVLNGYINFSFSGEFFANAATEAAGGNEKFGSHDFGAGKVAVIDFSSPNVGKPLHIGHIRSTILGDSIRNLMGFCGYKTVASNYLCEAGAQVAKLMLGVREFGAGSVRDEKDLLEYYVKISGQIDSDPQLKAKSEQILEAMENGDQSVAADLQRVREISLPPVYESYKTLGITFDEECFDSTLVPQSKAIVAEAVANGLAFKDKAGETVADLESRSKLPNLIILRSNGTTLYSTRDLALADSRWEKYRFDHDIYVTASEQNTHFKQVFKLLELLGRPYVPKCEHIGFGLIFLEGGQKLSTRKGSVLLLEDVLDEAVGKAKEEIKRKAEYSETQMEEIAREVGIGAVKFAVLRVTAEKNIQFSASRAVSFEGDSGAYLQYTFVRAQNILRKAKEQGIEFEGAAGGIEGLQFADAEREVVKLVATFPSVVESSCKNRAPQQVCDYLLKLAAAFSSFYAACPVLPAEGGERKKRLLIVAATRNAMANGLTLLGIRLPEKM